MSSLDRPDLPTPKAKNICYLDFEQEDLSVSGIEQSKTLQRGFLNLGFGNVNIYRISSQVEDFGWNRERHSRQRKQ